MADSDAPGRLKIVQDFVNTFDVEGGADSFTSPGALVDWLVDRDLVPNGAEASSDDLRRARQLREALRELASANHDEAPEDPAALEVLDGAAERAPMRWRFASGTPLIQPLATGIDAAMVTLLSITAGAMNDGTWVRLKACLKEDCRWVFYDHARNRSGKWCSMAVCGNRVKAQTYRHKQGTSG